MNVRGFFNNNGSVALPERKEPEKHGFPVGRW